MPDEHPGIANVHLDAVEHGERIVFLHSVRDGPANQSCGLQVAALAGVPAAVIERARVRLRELEDAAHAQAQADIRAGDNGQPEMAQLSLFPPEPPSPALRALRDLDPDALSPRQALAALYDLKALLGE